MKNLKKYIFAGIFMLLAVSKGFGQDQPSPRLYIGLNLYDAVFQNVHLQPTYRIGKKHFGIYGNLGYCFFRKYRYQKHLIDRVRGNFQGFGLQWRFKDADAKGEIYFGAGILWGMLWHDVEATIPNYYGDIKGGWKSISGYSGFQTNVGYAWLLGRWRLDAGIRLSFAKNGYGERYFHSYMPAMGRVNMFMKNFGRRRTSAVMPSLTLSYGL